jgi:hypothetical protein
MRITTLALTIVWLAGCDAESPAGNIAPAVAIETPAPAQPPASAGAPLPVSSHPPSATLGTVPVKFQGRYAADASACKEGSHESRLTIEASRIAFHESSGAITTVSSGPTEISITARLIGEGETRAANYSFRLSDDGRTLTDISNGGIRQRCD